MSPRSDARAALKAWLENAAIPGLDMVYGNYPRVTNRAFEFAQPTGQGPHRCHAVIFIEQEGELRFAIGGETSGKKRIDYLVSVELFHYSTEADTEIVMDDFDRILDAIKIRLRANRRLGATDDIVWQAGEGGYGIQCDFAPPVIVASEPCETYGRIRFEITQWITH